MASRITLDEAQRRLAEIKTIRSLQFDLLLRLLRIVAEYGPIGYTALFQSVSQVTEKPPSNSTYYHVLAAGKLLGLIQQELPTRAYVLTAVGARLIDAAQITHGGTSNAIDSISRLAEIVRESRRLNLAFFWLFRGPDNILPLHRGRAVYIEPIPDERSAHSERRSHQRWVRSEFCEPIMLDTVLTQSIIYGMRQWCLELGILDELVVAQSPEIRQDRAQVLFPVQDFDKAIEERSFEERLLPHFWALARRAANYWSVGIPELLHRLCPTENLGIEAVKTALAQWITTNRRYIVLSVFSPSVPMSAWQRRKGDYAALFRGYLNVDGSYISHIGLLSEIPERLQAKSVKSPNRPEKSLE